ncbi:polysaccharide deacetylase family protein [Paenibacillus sp. y28]|uniref:polysaccharide deacetylase family protein n=1 Tax=Paenibacillus sp. y28 TaxID=3129110 RepID=UPI003017BC83
MNRFILTAVFLLLVAAGCSQPSVQPPASQATTVPDAAPSPAGEAAAPASTPAASASPDSNGNTAAGKTGQPIPISYKMNANYDIVPLDPAGNKKVVLLTFDDGPKEKQQIDKLIDTLDKHKAKAIFFVNGYRVKQNPDLLKLIHDRGQIIGNHSWDHIELKTEPLEKVERQIGDVQAIVKELTGSAPVFFRPPNGAGGSDTVRSVAASHKLLQMNWSNGSEDWVKKYQNPEGLTQRVMDQLHSGSNILMHELPWTVEALDHLLTLLEEKGYSFVDPRSIETPQ